MDSAKYDPDALEVNLNKFTCNSPMLYDIMLDLIRQAKASGNYRRLAESLLREIDGTADMLEGTDVANGILQNLKDVMREAGEFAEANKLPLAGGVGPSNLLALEENDHG